MVVFGSIIQQLFKVKEHKKAIYLLQQGLDFPLALPTHLTLPYPQNISCTKKFSLKNNQKLFERVVVGLALGRFTTLALSLFQSAFILRVVKTGYLYNGLIMAFLSRHHYNQSDGNNDNNELVTRLVGEMKNEQIDMHPNTKFAFIQHLIHQGHEEKAVEYLTPMIQQDDRDVNYESDHASSYSTLNSYNHRSRADFYSLIPKYRLAVPGLDYQNDIDYFIEHMRKAGKPITVSFFNTFLSRILEPTTTANPTLFGNDAMKNDETKMDAVPVSVLQARKVFEEMQLKYGCVPDSQTFCIIIRGEFNSCGKENLGLGSNHRGLLYAYQALQKGLMSSALYSLVICGLVKQGEIQQGMYWFSRMTGLPYSKFLKNEKSMESSLFGPLSSPIENHAMVFYPVLYDSVGLETIFKSLMNAQQDALLFSLFYHHSIHFVQKIRSVVMIQIIEYLLDHGYFISIIWTLHLSGTNIPHVSRLLSKCFSRFLAPSKVQVENGQDWKRKVERVVFLVDQVKKKKLECGGQGLESRHLQFLSCILSLLPRSVSNCTNEVLDSNDKTEPVTDILLKVLVLEGIRKEKKIPKFCLGDSCLVWMVYQVSLSPFIESHHDTIINWDGICLDRVLGIERVVDELNDGINDFIVKQDGFDELVLGDLMQIKTIEVPVQQEKLEKVIYKEEEEPSRSIRPSRIRPFSISTVSKQDRKEIHWIRGLCIQKKFQQAENELERILIHQKEKFVNQIGKMSMLVEYLDMIVFHQLQISGLNVTEPLQVITYFKNLGLVHEIPADFVATWYATIMKRYPGGIETARRVYEECIESCGIHVDRVSRLILKRLADSYQPEAAELFRKEIMEPKGISLDFECYEAMITAWLHQNNIPFVLNLFGPLVGVHFSAGTRVEKSTFQSLGVPTGQMKNLVWKVMSVLMKMKQMDSQSISNLLQTIYFESARQNLQPRGKNVQVFIDFLIRHDQEWGIALVPHLEANLQKPRYFLFIEMIKKKGVVKKVEGIQKGVVNDFCLSIQEISHDQFGDCIHPFQIKIMWVCIEMLKHLNMNQVQRSFEFVDLAMVLLAEFVRVQLPGSRLQSIMCLPKPMENVVFSFFGQCKPYLMRWERFPSSAYDWIPLGLGTPCWVNAHDLLHFPKSIVKKVVPVQTGTSSKQITLSEPIISSGPVPKPATFTSVLDQTLPFVGNTLWLYNQIRRAGSPSPSPSYPLNLADLTFRQQCALSLVHEHKDKSIEFLIEKNPDLEKELSWVHGLR